MDGKVGVVVVAKVDGFGTVVGELMGTCSSDADRGVGSYNTTCQYAMEEKIN